MRSAASAQLRKAATGNKPTLRRASLGGWRPRTSLSGSRPGHPSSLLPGDSQQPPRSGGSTFSRVSTTAEAIVAADFIYRKLRLGEEKLNGIPGALKTRLGALKGILIITTAFSLLPHMPMRANQGEQDNELLHVVLITFS